MKAGSHSSLPGEIAFALVAFSVFDYEPVSLRYFHLDAQGKVTYLQASDLGAVGVPWMKDAGPNPYANVEIAFRLRQDPKAPLRVYRHIAANLDDSHFAANHPLALHLTSKGRVSVLIKAASYLLWFDTFSHIRAYLLRFDRYPAVAGARRRVRAGMLRTLSRPDAGPVFAHQERIPGSVAGQPQAYAPLLFRLP